MELTNDLLDSVGRYFTTLKHIGYKKDIEVHNLLILLFIEEILDGPFSQYITEDDYKAISKAMYCLYGTSCLLPYPAYKAIHTESQYQSFDEYRVTEDVTLRSVNTNSLRTLV